MGDGSLSWGADRPLSLRFARLAGTPGYSEVSLSAEIHLVTNSRFARLVGTPGLASFTGRTPCLWQDNAVHFAELKVFRGQPIG